MTLLVDVALRSTVILLAALIAAMALRRSAAATRHLVWTLAVVAVLMLPLAMIALPAWRVLPTVSRRDRPAITSTISVGPRFSAVAGIADRSGAAEGPPYAETAERPPYATLAFSVWALVASALLARVGLGLLAVRRLVRHAAPAGARWDALLRDACAAARVGTRVRVLISDEIAMPMTWGSSPAVLLLPSESDQWSDDRALVVLLHEVAHIRRVDWLTHALGRALVAAHWFNPLAWVAVRAMTREREHACDDFVLAQGARASEYAGHLLEIASAGHRACAHVLAPAMARRSELEGRLLSILTPRRRHATRLTAPLLTVAASVAAVAIAAAAPKNTSTAPSAPAPSAHAVIEGLRDGERRATESDRATVNVFAEALTDPSDEVREQAALGLALTQNATVIDPLVEALEDPDEDVREKAALGLGFRSESTVIEPLLTALRDSSAQVREKAAIGLGLRRSPRVTDALIKAAGDPDSQVREKVIMALGLSGDKRATATIVAAAKDPDRQVREKAVTALVALNNSTPELQSAIREGVAGALRFFGDAVPRK